MSFKMVPTCKCAICRKESPAKVWDEFFLFTKIIVPPTGWSGDFSMFGDCYCKECTSGIKYARAKHARTVGE